MVWNEYKYIDIENKLQSWIKNLNKICKYEYNFMLQPGCGDLLQCTPVLHPSLCRLRPICSRPAPTSWSWASRRREGAVQTSTSDSTEARSPLIHLHTSLFILSFKGPFKVLSSVTLCRTSWYCFQSAACGLITESLSPPSSPHNSTIFIATYYTL